jgi:hypothetical protein
VIFGYDYAMLLVEPGDDGVVGLINVARAIKLLGAGKQAGTDFTPGGLKQWTSLRCS